MKTPKEWLKHLRWVYDETIHTDFAQIMAEVFAECERIAVNEVAPNVAAAIRAKAKKVLCTCAPCSFCKVTP